MGKPFELIFFVAVLAWVGIILLADGPRNRIEQICKPVEWSGRLAGSMASLSSSEAESKTRLFFTNRTQDCYMLIFKQFYEADYRAAERAMAEARRQAESKVENK